MVAFRTLLGQGDAASVKEAFATGAAKVDGRDAQGDPHLAWAIRTDKPAAVRILLDAGADIEATTAHGSHMLPLAKVYRRDEIIDLLNEAFAARAHAEQKARVAEEHAAVVRRQQLLREHAHQRPFRIGLCP